MQVIEGGRVGRRRRFFAVYIDCFVAMAGIMPLVILPMLVFEYLAVGEWVWSFSRDYGRATDLVMLPLVISGFYFIYFYFKWHFDRDKQTIGQYLLGMKLIPNGPSPSIAKRYLTAWANLAWWPIWPWTVFKRQDDYWWDRTSDTIVRRTRRLTE